MPTFDRLQQMKEHETVQKMMKNDLRKTGRTRWWYTIKKRNTTKKCYSYWKISGHVNRTPMAHYNCKILHRPSRQQHPSSAQCNIHGGATGRAVGSNGNRQDASRRCNLTEKNRMDKPHRLCAKEERLPPILHRLPKYKFRKDHRLIPASQNRRVNWLSRWCRIISTLGTKSE